MKPEDLAALAFKDVHPDSGYAVAKQDSALSKQMITRFKQSEDAWKFYQEQPADYRKQSAHWVTNAKREESSARWEERMGRALKVCQIASHDAES